MDIVSKIMDYEDGSLTENEIIEFFQYMIDTGLCWSLQGSYGRTASALIKGGYCIMKGNRL